METIIHDVMNKIIDTPDDLLSSINEHFWDILA